MNFVKEAVENYEEQYDMQHNYGCYILFDGKLTNALSHFSDKDFERCAKEFRELTDIYVAGATQGAITLQRFTVDGSVFDNHHTDWFIGGKDEKIIKAFLGFVFYEWDLVGKGKAIVIDRQTDLGFITDDGNSYKPLKGMERFVKFQHGTQGKGGYIYYTYNVDNLNVNDNPVGARDLIRNVLVRARNYALTKLGKIFQGVVLRWVKNANDIEAMTNDGGLLGRFLNEHDKIDSAPSFLISLPEATSEQLLMIGTDICNYFHQTSVVVEDLNKNLCYFANGKKFAGKTKDEQKS